MKTRYAQSRSQVASNTVKVGPIARVRCRETTENQFSPQTKLRQPRRLILDPQVSSRRGCKPENVAAKQWRRQPLYGALRFLGRCGSPTERVYPDDSFATVKALRGLGRSDRTRYIERDRKKTKDATRRERQREREREGLMKRSLLSQEDRLREFRL